MVYISTRVGLDKMTKKTNMANTYKTLSNNLILRDTNCMHHVSFMGFSSKIHVPAIVVVNPFGVKESSQKFNCNHCDLWARLTCLKHLGVKHYLQIHLTKWVSGAMGRKESHCKTFLD